jgi:hypothetical protein
MKPEKPLRQTMPGVAAFIDELREAFGADAINAAIRAGLDRQPTFWAQEGGHEVGTRFDDSGCTIVNGTQIVISLPPPAGDKGATSPRKGRVAC